MFAWDWIFIVYVVQLCSFIHVYIYVDVFLTIENSMLDLSSESYMKFTVTGRGKKVNNNIKLKTLTGLYIPQPPSLIKVLFPPPIKLTTTI